MISQAWTLRHVGRADLNRRSTGVGLAASILICVHKGNVCAQGLSQGKSRAPIRSRMWESITLVTSTTRIAVRCWAI